jgi:hypothetical protein
MSIPKTKLLQSAGCTAMASGRSTCCTQVCQGSKPGHQPSQLALRDSVSQLGLLPLSIGDLAARVWPHGIQLTLELALVQALCGHGDWV